MRGLVIVAVLASIPIALYLGARLLLPPVGRVEVVGNSRVSLEEIMGILEPYLRGRNLLTVPTEGIVRALTDHPMIEECEVWKKFPGSLLIVIEERPDLGELGGIPEEVLPQAHLLVEGLGDLGVKEVRYQRGFFTLVTAGGTRVRMRASEVDQGVGAVRRVLALLGDRVPTEVSFAGPNKVAVKLGGVR